MIALDLCAGAGGLSLGLSNAGFRVHGVEIDADACATHRAAVGPCDHASLWDWSPTGAADLVAGGIPCQSHSAAGKRAKGGRAGTGDDRGALYRRFLEIATLAQARAVLIENVRGIRTSPSASHGSALREILAAIEAAGFRPAIHTLLNAADYGVPQNRKRIFIVAFRDAVDASRFQWPSPTHSRDGRLLGLSPWVTVREALGIEGDRAEGLVDGATMNSPQGARMVRMDAPAPTVSGCSRELIGALRIAGVYDRPATTIDTTGQLSTAGYQSTNKAGAVRLSTAQMAALQSFPPSYAWQGTATSIHRQVGNAVPPPLAEAVANSIFLALSPSH